MRPYWKGYLKLAYTAPISLLRKRSGTPMSRVSGTLAFSAGGDGGRTSPKLSGETCAVFAQAGADLDLAAMPLATDHRGQIMKMLTSAERIDPPKRARKTKDWFERVKLVVAAARDRAVETTQQKRRRQ
jgi:hypothetical protein